MASLSLIHCTSQVIDQRRVLFNSTVNKKQGVFFVALGET
jgi:hypothetical protein